MSVTNLGTQTINWKYKTSLKGSNLSKMFNGCINPGIYLNNNAYITAGTGLVTSFTGNQITINAFTAVFKASSTQTVTISTAVPISLSTDGGLGYITSAAPYIVMSYTWADQIINYIDFAFKAVGDITAYDIVIGKAVFTGGVVTSIDYSEASYPPYYNPTTQEYNVSKKLKVSGKYMGSEYLCPVGTIIPVIAGYFSNGSNGSFTSISLVVDDCWQLCNGAAYNNVLAPVYNTTGRYLPNLSDNRFLMGSNTAGSMGGSNSVNLTSANLPPHTHVIDHDHGAHTHTGTTGDQSADHTHSDSGHAHYSTLVLWGGSSGGNGYFGSISTGTYSSIWTGTSYANLGVQTANHTHSFTANAYSISYTGNSGDGAFSNSAVENRPSYLSAKYYIRVY